jgi:hypothetical protein
METIGWRLGVSHYKATSMNIRVRSFILSGAPRRSQASEAKSNEQEQWLEAPAGTKGSPPSISVLVKAAIMETVGYRSSGPLFGALFIALPNVFTMGAVVKVKPHRP